MLFPAGLFALPAEQLSWLGMTNQRCLGELLLVSSWEGRPWEELPEEMSED